MRDVVVRIPFVGTDSLAIEVRMTEPAPRSFYRTPSGRLVELGPSWMPVASRDSLIVRMIGNEAELASEPRLQFRVASPDTALLREPVVVP
jgi:hypothetical protein